MGIEDFLIYLSGALYLATFVVLASFSGKSTRWRPMVSLFAVGLAGTSAGLGVMSFLAPPIVARAAPMVLQTLHCICVFALVVGCRGNLAKLLPPFKRQKHDPQVRH